jgi:hypothetical protein
MLGFVTRLGVLGVLGGFTGCEFSSPACVPGGSSPNTCPIGNDVDLTLSGRMITYDTVMHELEVDGATMPVTHMIVTTQAGNVDAIVAHNVRLTAGAQLRATGMRPFVVVARGSITLEDGALIDVSNGGAGALPACSTPPMPGADGTGGGAGGGGAGYGAGGGKGGNGNGNNNGQPSAQTRGGTEGFSIAMPAMPMGGCPGAPGGKGAAVGDMNGPGGAGGAGGGAIYLVAADRIELGNMATLTAGGGGGHGGGQRGSSYKSGGGGGGSGGMVLLESPHVIGLQAQIAANGGGGGEGADLDRNPPYTPHAGRDGKNGSPSTSRALGGTGGASGGADGGRGGSLESPVGDAVTAVLDSGGGGGGGGVGFIHVVSSDFQVGTVSPAAIMDAVP